MSTPSPQPDASSETRNDRLTGAEAIAAGLVEAGIDTVFGIPGLYNVAIYDAIRRRTELRTVAVRHEQGAAFMADGYARASGRQAACLLLPGCGVLNALTGLSEAYADSSAVLLIATQVERRHIDQDHGLLHELTGQLDIVSRVTKCTERVSTAAEIPDAMRRAVAALRDGRPRPVALEIPLDVQTEAFEPADSFRPAGPPVAAHAADSALVARAAQALAGCSRPLILAGGGVVAAGAYGELVALAERLGAPVLTTGMGVTSIPSDHPLACGVAWVASADIRPLVAACDGLLAIGTRLNRGMTADWDLPLPEVTVRIDVDPHEIERNLPFDLRIVADARVAAALLVRELTRMEVDRHGVVEPTLYEAQQRYRAAHWARIGTTRPWAAALRAALPRDAVISADMSLFWADMLGSFALSEPRTMLFPWGMGTLGFGIPAAIGAKLALPDRPVIAIVGDGAFLFTGAELATAVQERLAVPIVVANNNAYGMIKMQQRLSYGADVAVDLVTPDFVALARGFRAEGVRAATPEDLGAALTAALAADGPTVIEVPWGVTFAERDDGGHVSP